MKYIYIRISDKLSIHEDQLYIDKQIPGNCVNVDILLGTEVENSLLYIYVMP